MRWRRASTPVIEVISKVPRVQFRCPGMTRRGLRGELRALLLDSFAADAAPWCARAPHCRCYLIEAKIHSREFVLQLHRGCRKTGMWALRLVPLVGNVPFSRHVVVPAEFIPDLQAACRCAQVAVTSLPDVVAPYWLFEWRKYHSEPVWTPDALPWDA